jgi:uncharacterized phage-associated protein
MANDRAKNAILYIVEKACQERISMGKTRLMKLLYLLDIEHYKFNKKIYTNLDWIYYKYGPFSFDVENLCKEIGLDEIEKGLKKDRIVKLLKIDHWKVKKADVEPKIRTLLNHIYNRWALSDLNSLLDYVYFETEPMIHAQYKQILDFSTVVPQRMRKKIKISSQKKKELIEVCKRIKQNLDKLELPPGPLPISSQDLKITSIWDEEENSRLKSLKGTVHLKQKE